MVHTRRVLVFILFIFAITACDTVLGPPRSEPELPQPPLTLPYRYDMFIEGEPNLNAITIRGGYYIWKVANSWHVRVARTDVPHLGFQKDVFAGSVLVENGFVVMQRQNVLPPDELRFEKNNISFGFEVERSVKGFDFAVQPILREYCISFDLLVNGLASSELIHLGRSMFIPQSFPITICFH